MNASESASPCRFRPRTVAPALLPRILLVVTPARSHHCRPAFYQMPLTKVLYLVIRAHDLGITVTVSIILGTIFG